MKIIVTGGAGFIGSHVVDRYIDLGHDVAVVDDLSKGRMENVNPKAKFHKADIRDTGLVKKIFKEEKPDIVNHHAALAEVSKSVVDPTGTFEVNVLGTVNVLLASGEAGIKKFLFSSTGGALYGNPPKIPADEDTEIKPLSPYGLSKYLGEECIESYARMYNFPYVTFRYSNVFGPRQNPKGEAGIVAIFSGLIKSGKNPTIFGDGTKTRDYLYVGDIVEANAIGLEKGENLTVNLGSGIETSDQEMFDSIARALGYKDAPEYAPFREGEVNRIALDAKRAEKTLGWKAKTSLTEGIKKTVEVQ